jgi:hypothetical protein
MNLNMGETPLSHAHRQIPFHHENTAKIPHKARAVIIEHDPVVAKDAKPEEDSNQSDPAPDPSRPSLLRATFCFRLDLFL